MKKHIALFLTAVLVLTALISFGGTALAANVEFNITPKPSEMTSGGDVTFEYDVTSDTAFPDCKIYYAGSSVAELSNLIEGTTVPGSFTMNVTDSMLGQSLKFEIRSGDTVLKSKSVKVKKKELSVRLDASAKVSRNLAAAGDVIKLTIEVENNGEADITDIDVKAPGINDNKRLTSATFALKAGKSHKIEYNYTMGSKDITFSPTIDYKVNGAAQKQKKLDAITITLESRNVSVTVTPSTTTAQPGENVELKLEIVNSGNVSYTDLSVMMNGIGVDFPSSRLKAGETKSETYTESFQTTTQVVFTVTLKDHTGASRSVDSDPVTIKLPVDQQAVKERLQFSMSVDRPQLTSAGVVNFTGFVSNGAEYTLTDIKVDEAQAGNIMSISELGAGQSANIDWSADINETTTYNFTLSVTDADGNVYPVQADPITVTVQTVAEETPGFDDAVTVEPETSAGLGTTGVLLIIAGVIVLLIIGVGVALLVLWKKGQTSSPGKKKKVPPGRKRPSVSKGGTAQKSYRDRNNF